MSGSCIFVGPTLSASEVQASLEARCLPPVAQGDVIRAVRDHRPQAIGIVDGFFGGAPAVWHKEILWAMTEGVAVFGAASMGALRAAELHGFGMQGVGRIFEDYRDGVLDDDDEVAVVHAPAEMGYAALSEPMVTIRATLARAEAEGILPSDARRALEAHAKALHFPERSWPALLEGADRQGIGAAEAAKLRNWLPTGRLDVKRADALAMLEAMRGPAAGRRPDGPRLHLERTHFLAGLEARPAATHPVGSDETIPDLVLDEFRLGSRAVFGAITGQALLAFASEGAPGDRDREPGPDAVTRKMEAIRTANGLFGRASLEAWLAGNDLDPKAFRRLAVGAVRVDRLAERATPSLAAHLLDALRLGGHYPALAGRARRKAARLVAAGPRALAGLSSPERLALRLWFAARLGLPDDAGLETILAASGFADAPSLDRVLHRERLYLTLAGPDRED